MSVKEGDGIGGSTGGAGHEHGTIFAFEGLADAFPAHEERFQDNGRFPGEGFGVWLEHERPDPLRFGERCHEGVLGGKGNGLQIGHGAHFIQADAISLKEISVINRVWQNDLVQVFPQGIVLSRHLSFHWFLVPVWFHDLLLLVTGASIKALIAARCLSVARRPAST